MRTITTTVTVYKFDELSDEAKEKAMDEMYDINVMHEWWEGVYEDARNVGLEIEAFDIGRGSYCNAKFIEDAVYTATKIKEDHGETCETYKTAIEFLKERDAIVDAAPKDENGEFEDEYELDSKLDDIESEFLKSISEDYRIMLTNEYDYQTSREAVIDTIEANEYEFTEDGKHY